MQQKSASSKKPSETDDRQFSLIKGEQDGHPMLAIIASDLKKYPSKSKYRWFLSLSVPLIDPTTDGLPNVKDLDALNAWEDEIEARIAKQGKYFYFGHVTRNGSREVLFYLEKPDPVLSELQKIRESNSTRPFAVVCEKDEHWKKVDDYVQLIKHQSSN
jgi:hypothetical protein